MTLTAGKPNNISMCYHWARMIELLHAIEKIRDLLHDSDLQGGDLVVKGKRRSEFAAILEAPRGTLFHHYRVNEHDQVTMANLIVSTTHNNEPMNRAVTKIAQDHLSGVPEITDALLNHIEVGIRAYDPCLSCATHALGTMPLEVTLVDASGAEITRRARP
jgi:NAD-reducing hydrogenase large subunit